jgi:ketosteroid isomerase-like protein
MSTQENVQIVKDFLAAMGRGDTQALLALSAEDIEWMICFRRLPKCWKLHTQSPPNS